MDLTYRIPGIEERVIYKAHQSKKSTRGMSFVHEGHDIGINKESEDN